MVCLVSYCHFGSRKVFCILLSDSPLWPPERIQERLRKTKFVTLTGHKEIESLHAKRWVTQEEREGSQLSNQVESRDQGPVRSKVPLLSSEWSTEEKA